MSVHVNSTKFRGKRGGGLQFSYDCLLFVKNTVNRGYYTIRDITGLYIEIFLVNLVSFVDSLRNNPFGFIEVECRGGIQAYHCRSGSLTYRRFSLSIRIRRLAQSASDDEKRRESKK